MLSGKVNIFGAALDFLDDPERIGVKNAYLAALKRGLDSSALPADPYDAIAPLALELLDGPARAAGKVKTPGRFTPRPPAKEAGKVTAEACREFMDSGGPAKAVAACADYFASLLPSIPVMIGVDHMLTAGPITALSRSRRTKDLAVVVIDSHFDAVPPAARAPAGVDASFGGGELCGDFLAALMESGRLSPDRLFVVGPSDHPGGMGEGSRYARAYHYWIENGVRVYPKSRALEPGFEEFLADEIGQCGADSIYVSLDADAGSVECMNAVRFMDCVGLPEEKIMGIAASLNGLIRDGDAALAGLDVCEVDVHLLDLVGPDGKPDRTAGVCARFIATLLGGSA